MIKTRDAIRIARSLIGTPYSELDCINLIKKVIRTAPGGVPGYTTAGTNALWRSYDSAPKYRDLTERHNDLVNVPAGAIVFKADGLDFHHAGIATDVGTVVHSSSTQGGRGVVETPLTTKEGWNCWGVHRYIATQTTEEDTPMYKAEVNLSNKKSSLNLRNGPSTKDMVIGSIPHGEVVDVLVEADNWLYVRYGGMSGYASAEYLVRVSGDAEEEPAEENTEVPVPAFTTLMKDDGTMIRLEGAWRVAED